MENTKNNTYGREEINEGDSSKKGPSDLRKVKLHVITGFLGSGKTTFINAIINSGLFEDERIVLIENEFGNINIDSKRFEQQLFSVVEITNGCICCTLKGQVIESLLDIYKTIKPDRVLIEPSGIFNTYDLKSIIESPEIVKRYDFYGLYTIVDLEHYKLEKMRTTTFYQSQLKMADHMIISKLARLNNEMNNESEALISKLSKEFSHVFIHMHKESMWDKSFGDLIFNCKTRTKLSCIDDEDEVKTSQNGHNINGLNLSSYGIENIKKHTLTEFNEFKEKVIKGVFGEIIRLKGYMNIDNKDFLIDYVNKSMEIRPIEYKDVSQLVFIGTSIDRTKILLQTKEVKFRRK